MKIVIADIPEEGLEIDVDEAVETGELELTGPVKGRLRVDKHATEVDVSGEVSTRARLRCGRCLKDFETEIRLPVNVVYLPLGELGQEEPHELGEADLDTSFYSGEELDIGELVTEQVLLSVPMKPLCSEDCKGICPTCGADLSTDTCTCAEEKTDPRWEKLKNLLDKGKE